METWDAVKKAQDYLRKANALHPEESKGSDLYEYELAQQDLYYECYMTSFSIQKLRQFLMDSMEGRVKIPEEINQGVYLSAFRKLAEAELERIASY